MNTLRPLEQTTFSRFETLGFTNEQIQIFIENSNGSINSDLPYLNVEKFILNHILIPHLEYDSDEKLKHYENPNTGVFVIITNPSMPAYLVYPTKIPYKDFTKLLDEFRARVNDLFKQHIRFNLLKNLNSSSMLLSSIKQLARDFN